MALKLFTHTDLDGVGCAILAKIAYSKKHDKVDVEYCNYDDINTKVSDFIQSEHWKDYDAIHITDISVSEEVAKLIDKTFGGDEILLIDHHATASWLNKYEWAKVNSFIDSCVYISHFNLGVKSCGTQMYYDFLLDEIEESGCEDENDIYLDKTFNFVEMVRQYDTWEWNTIYKNDKPKKLNNLLYIYGRDAFVEKYLKEMSWDGHLLNDTDLLVLSLEQQRIDKYIAKKQEKIIPMDILGYKAGVVFCEQYQSETGNVLATNNPQFDFIALLDLSQSISYRSVKDTIDLGKDVAQIFGGGGHAKAAGSQISVDLQCRLIDIIFNNKEM